MLMSLALDEQLSDREAKEFHEDLERYPALAEKWTVWQHIDSRFQEEPAMAPECGFMQRFQKRLTQQIRRRNLRLGITVGLLTVVLWLAVVACGMVIGSFILDNQSAWLGDLIHNATYLLNLASVWGNALLDTAMTMLYTPQAWAVLLGYLALVALVLTFWTRFLRRSTYILADAVVAEV